MERLILKQHALAKALARLNNMIECYGQKKGDLTIEEEDFLAYQDSVVKRFEISFDLLWKYLKEYLFAIHGVEALSPKKVFREALLQGVLLEDEVTILVNMCNDRNLTAHTYDAEHSAEVAEMVIEYYYKIKPALFRIVEQGK